MADLAHEIITDHEGNVFPFGAKNAGRLSIQRAHTDERVLRPEDAPQESPEAFFLELDASERPFYQEGTFYLKTRQGTKKLRICSVDASVIEEEAEKLRPVRPKINDRMGMPLTDLELQDRFPKYRRAMERYNKQVGYLYILYGTQQLQLKSRTGDVVWAADGTVRQQAEAIQALEDMGLTNIQWVEWYNAISNLSRAESQESDADFLPDSASSSGYL